MDYLLNHLQGGTILPMVVLNLIINGLPSKLNSQAVDYPYIKSFKPYYKWITF